VPALPPGPRISRDLVLCEASPREKLVAGDKHFRRRVVLREHRRLRSELGTRLERELIVLEMGGR
jgi:hypothetical protein